MNTTIENAGNLTLATVAFNKDGDDGSEKTTGQGISALTRLSFGFRHPSS
ncbi:MAG: hypothetical protein KA368_12755 [Acidobacteria bacterium]|nr:hypothetical protein [Acidobacteriota bacterium]